MIEVINNNILRQGWFNDSYLMTCIEYGDFFNAPEQLLSVIFFGRSRGGTLLCDADKIWASLSLQFDNAQSPESQSGKFALAPAGLEDERALGWHGSVDGGRGGALSSLSCLACCGWVRPTSAVHFAPAASCSGVQSWSVCSWITSFPFAHGINPHQPQLKALTWAPLQFSGLVIKRWRGPSGAWVGRGWTMALAFRWAILD